jgi:hypothetical protein
VREQVPTEEQVGGDDGKRRAQEIRDDEADAWGRVSLRRSDEPGRRIDTGRARCRKNLVQKARRVPGTRAEVQRMRRCGAAPAPE